MTVKQIVQERAQGEDLTTANAIDPFAIVAALIVSILLSSLFLWINGGHEIKNQYGQHRSDRTATLASGNGVSINSPLGSL